MAILKLKPSNWWKRETFGAKLQKNRKNQDFSDNWKHGGVIINCTLLESQRPVRSWNQVVSETKASEMQETINWKYSNPGKIQLFTFSALTKIHTYCLKILKSTGDHISLKLWIIRFDLRKKKRTSANQTTENEIWQLWTSKCQPAQSGKVLNGLFYKKKTVAREKLDTVSRDDWSLEWMKEQDPRWERVKRSFSQQLTRSTYQKDSIAVANSQ